LKALIVGGAGFVGGHLIDYLCSLKTVDVFATKLPFETIKNHNLANEHILNLDVMNYHQVKKVLQKINPDYVFHLSAQSNVSLSWRDPVLTYNINILGTVNLLEVLKELKVTTRVLLIGSAEEYGIVAAEALPINEHVMVNPCNPYAVSKVAQELTAKVYVDAFAMNIVMVRAFNHIGPGQSPSFVISDFAKQIAAIELQLQEPILYVGNLDVSRDFTDVRDIVAGYWELIRKGEKGEIYNIGSGKSYNIRELLKTLIGFSKKEIIFQVDQNKFRPTDLPDLCADIRKIQSTTVWKPVIDIHTSLKDTLNYWRNKCQAN
jgi:GDP-4-dehydro-6-deoxy-D-mannose reductase